MYGELRRIAEAQLARLPPGQTLQPTALVHEAFVKLVGSEDPGWSGRAHFFMAAAQAMREILVDLARRKGRVKHGAGRRRQELNEGTLAASPLDQVPLNEDLLALDRALTRMQADYPRPAEVVMLRYFAGLSASAAGEILGLSKRTIEREFRFACAWLHKELVGAAPSV